MPLVTRAELSVPNPQMSDEPLAKGGGVFERLLALAAMAQAIDPSLGPYLRAYRRQPHHDQGGPSNYRLVFTHDSRSTLPLAVMDDRRAEDFFEVLERLLPEGEAQAERQRLQIRLRKMGADVLDGALKEGHAQAAFDLKTDDSNPDATFTYTTPIAVRDNAFAAHPDLAQRVFFAPVTPGAGMERPIDRLRQRFHQVRTTLARDLETVGAAEVARVTENIAALNKVSVEGDTFEERFRHGWVAYALSQGAKGWTNVLLQKAAVSPHAHYGKFAPITVAAAVNDEVATRDLLAAGVSPNTVLRGWPRLFVGPEQDKMSRLGGEFIPLLCYAVAAGSAAVSQTLLKNGAEPNFATEKLDRPLHLAAAAGFDPIVRGLLQHQADPMALNGNGFRAEEMVPDISVYDSLHALLQQASANRRAEADTQLQAEVRQAEPTPLEPTLAQALGVANPVAAAELWTRPGRRPSTPTP
jgi:hypothetical protein